MRMYIAPVFPTRLRLERRIQNKAGRWADGQPNDFLICGTCWRHSDLKDVRARKNQNKQFVCCLCKPTEFLDELRKSCSAPLPKQGKIESLPELLKGLNIRAINSEIPVCGHCYNYEAAVHNEYRGLYWAVDDTTVNDNEDVCAPVIPKPTTYLSHDELSVLIHEGQLLRIFGGYEKKKKSNGVEMRRSIVLWMYMRECYFEPDEDRIMRDKDFNYSIILVHVRDCVYYEADKRIVAHFGFSRLGVAIPLMPGDKDLVSSSSKKNVTSFLANGVG
eukprot:scaffold61018_cov52-Cyclotella_meneghiniana.AAC.11